jgi:uncharacterized membrane protein YhhN
MGIYLIPVPFIVVLIVFYKVYRDRNDLKKIAVIQPLITCLSMVVCLLSYFTPGFNLAYTGLILAGLVLSIAADIIFIDVKDPKKLAIALGLFLLIYIAYSVAVAVRQGFLSVDLYIAALVLLVAIVPLAYIWKGLKTLQIPVLLYVLVLVFFITLSISTFFGSQFVVIQSVMITAASCMFLIGDLELAISSFKKPIPLYIGPITYATSQMLMALSACYFPH